MKNIKAILGEEKNIHDKTKLELYLDMLEKNIIRSKNMSEQNSSLEQSPSPPKRVGMHKSKSGSGDLSSDNKDDKDNKEEEDTDNKEILQCR